MRGLPVMRACVSLLVLLSACTVGEPPSEPEPGSKGPMLLESSAPASDPKVAVPAPTGPAEEPTKPEPAPAPTPAATPAASEQAPDLVPRIVGATGPDAEMFYKAEAMRGQGDPKGMRDALLELVRDHPTSKFMPWAYLMLGDEFFDRDEFKSSANFYEKALTYPNDDTGAYALYKVAWCQISLGNDTEALASFMKAAERAQRVPTDQGRALVQASIRDTVIPYLRVGKLARAPAFYKKLTTGTAVPLEEILAKLATALIDVGRRDELASACKSSGMPPWCASPLDRLK